MKENLQPLNPANFIKMAHGDPVGLAELALEFFEETRHLIRGWSVLVEAGGSARLCEELHRCKGGASLFGLERLVDLLSECERPSYIEQSGFDIATFEKELDAAEAAVTALAQAAT